MKLDLMDYYSKTVINKIYVHTRELCTLHSSLWVENQQVLISQRLIKLKFMKCELPYNDVLENIA